MSVFLDHYWLIDNSYIMICIIMKAPSRHSAVHLQQFCSKQNAIDVNFYKNILNTTTAVRNFLHFMNIYISIYKNTY